MNKLLIAVLMLSGCATMQPTHNAQIRRIGEGKARTCRFFYSGRYFQYRSCMYEVRDWCQSQGLEKTCGEDALWTDH